MLQTLTSPMKSSHYLSASKVMAVMMTFLILASVIPFHHHGPIAVAQDGENIPPFQKWPNIIPNVKTFVVPNVTSPEIDDSAFIHPFAVVIGDCHIGRQVLMAPTAVCRADEGVPIHVGDYSNIQDGVILHALDTVRNGTNIDNKRFSQDGER